MKTSWLIAFCFLSSAATALAADTKKNDTPKGVDEKVNVESIKEKYWARGDESELGVVQNRLYSKEHKFEFGVFGGSVSTDPFLSVHALGASMAYHFTEYFAAQIEGWHDFV